MTRDGSGDGGRGGRGADDKAGRHPVTRPLWPIGLPDPPASETEAGEGAAPPDRDDLGSLLLDNGRPPEPDLGEIVVILLISTLAGLRDRLERDGFHSAAGLVHDLVEIADDFVMRFQP